MGQIAPDNGRSVPRRWFGVRWSLVAVAICFFVAWAVRFGQQIWTNDDPFHLIRRGTAVERQKAALDLGEPGESRDIDEVIASLIGASEDSDAVARSVALDSLSGLVHRMLLQAPPSPAAQAKYDERVARTVQTLTKALADSDPTVRKSAAFGFGLVGSVRVLELPPQLVVAAFDDESNIVQDAAAKALFDARLTATVVPGLIKALASPYRSVRMKAASFLGRFGPGAEPSVPMLLAILKEPFDREHDERTAGAAWQWDPACGAAKSLGKISSSRQVIAALTEMLSSDIDARVASAAAGLTAMGPQAAEAVPSLIATYNHVLESPKHALGQFEISRALGAIAPRSPSSAAAVAILIRALDSKDWSIRVGAVEALGKFGDDAAGAVPRLRDLERNDSAHPVKAAATAALAAIEGIPQPIIPY